MAKWTMRQAAAKAVTTLLATPTLRTVSVFVSPTQVAKATRRRLRRVRPQVDLGDLVVTVGRPNYREREILRRAKGRTFPFIATRVLAATR